MTLPKIKPYGMFVGAFVPNWIMRRKDLKPSTKLVYGRLAQFQGREGEAYPGVVTLAEELGMSLATVKRSLAALRAEKLLSSDRRMHTSNCYHFHFRPDWVEPADLQSPEKWESLATPILTKQGTQLGLDMGPTAQNEPSMGSKRAGFPLKDPEEEIQIYPGPGPKTFERSASEPPGPRSDAPPNSGPAPKLETAELPDGEPVEEQPTVSRTASVEERLKRLHLAEKEGRKKAEFKPSKAAQLKRRLDPTHRSSNELYKFWIHELRGIADTPVADQASRKELAQIKMLVERFDGKTIEQTFRYVIRNWGSIGARYWKDKAAALPTIQTVLAVDAALVTEAAQWEQYRPVIEEYEAWERTIGNRIVRPDRNLLDRYEAAQKALKALELDKCGS